MPLKNLVKFMYRMVVIEVVEVIERSQIQRIVRPVRQSFGFIRRLLRKPNTRHQRQEKTHTQSAEEKQSRQFLVASNELRPV